MELAPKYLRNMLTENVSVTVKNLHSSKAKLYILPFIKIRYKQPKALVLLDLTFGTVSWWISDQKLN